MVELIVNDKSLELSRKGSDIKYTIQISDIFDIASVSSSYTNSFNIPKTPHNTQVFNQLGIIGDTSTVPYDRVNAVLTNHGMPIINNGWLSIKETGTDYKVSIIDGMIDFFKAIENKTLGNDLDLTVFNHIKDIDTVIDSFDNPYYKYIVADYGGKKIGNTEGSSQRGINIDYLVPCFSVKALFDLIFATFGYTYNQSALSFITGLYITYPKAPQEATDPIEIAVGNKNFWASGNFSTWNGLKYIATQEFWDATGGTGAGNFVNNWQFVVPETGGYRIDVDIDAYHRSILGTNRPAVAHILVNGNSIVTANTDAFATVSFNHIYYATQGDVLQFRLTGYEPWGSEGEIRHLNTNFRINKITLGSISLTEAFKDFTIKDFFKEIIWRTGLTPIINKDNNYIDFIPLSERLDFDNAIDWTDKYVKRIKESYVQEGYAQTNVFELKHNNEADTRGNGYLYVSNRNLKDREAIVQSKMYAPELVRSEFESINGLNTFETDTYPIWQQDVKRDEEDNVIIEYKGLSNRFYFLRFENYNTAGGADGFRLVSEALNTSQLVATLPIAINNETLFDELVFKNYTEYSEVLNNFRAHDIEFALDILDIVELDMTKPIYVKQEGQYYLRNKINWQEGSTCMVECIRINKV